VDNEHELQAREPIDPDVDATAVVIRSRERQTVALVTVGGIVGAVARYEAGLIWPTNGGAFPWTTLGINLLGSLALAMLVVLASDRWPERSWLRPLIGTGVIGGFTTFSTFSVDIKRLLANGHAPTAVAYVALTLAGCSALTWIGANLARRGVARWTR
jgi:CrcB protein